MIHDKRQYEVTKKEIERFEIALGHTVTDERPSLPLEIRQAQCAAMESVLAEPREEVWEYERNHPEVVT